MDLQLLLSSTTSQRLANLRIGFETPEQVIERLIVFYEVANGSTLPVDTNQPMVDHLTLSPRTELTFIPSDQVEFKRLLLEKKQAWVLLFMKNGHRIKKRWDAKKFSQDSNLIGNLRSGYLRGGSKKGITRAIVAINEKDIDQA